MNTGLASGVLTSESSGVPVAESEVVAEGFDQVLLLEAVEDSRETEADVGAGAGIVTVGLMAVVGRLEAAIGGGGWD